MKIAIIGAGPAGLYFATLCQNNNLDYTIFEASNIVGGQLTHIYPQKEIVNIPNITSITAEDYITQLYKQLDTSKIKLNSKITDFEELKKSYDYIIIATGVGEYQPIKIGFENEENYNILYSLNNIELLRNKKVIIFGGGNSALDWAKQLSDISDTTLIHRRDLFKGDDTIIKNCKNLKILLSYIPDSIENKVVTIKSVKDNSIKKLAYDYILVNFGIMWSKTSVISDNKTFIIGDALAKTRTIAFGMLTAEDALQKILLNVN